MFTAFDETAFRQAIKDKDYLCLKVNTISTMLDDPTFERGETMKVLQILEEQVPEIFEEYVDLSYEERLDRSEWDKRYFTKLTYWFQENFAKCRVEYIKEVGRVVHKDTARKYAESMGKPNLQHQSGKRANISTTQTKQSVIDGQKADKNKTEIFTTTNTADNSKNVNPMNAPEEIKRNLPIAGVILAVGALVLVGILLLMILIK